MSGLVGWDPDEDEWDLYLLDSDYFHARDLANEHPRKLRELQDMFTMQAARNDVFPIGRGLYLADHPEEGRGSTLTEWTVHPGQVRIPESLAPKYTSGFSTLATIDVGVDLGSPVALDDHWIILLRQALRRRWSVPAASTIAHMRGACGASTVALRTRFVSTMSGRSTTLSASQSSLVATLRPRRRSRSATTASWAMSKRRFARHRLRP